MKKSNDPLLNATLLEEDQSEIWELNEVVLLSSNFFMRILLAEKNNYSSVFYCNAKLLFQGDLRFYPLHHSKSSS